MFCTSCGTKNAAESNFCKQCGHKIEKVSPSPVTEAAFTKAMPAGEQVTALLEKAYQARRDGDFPAAIAFCQEALAVAPDSASVHSLLGQIYAAQGEREQAIREYERVLHLNPGSIADRIKLDELRGEVRTGRGTTPHIVLTEPKWRESSGGRQFLLLAGIVPLCLLVGGALALKIRSSSENPAGTQTAALNPNPSGRESAGFVPDRNTVPNVSGGSLLKGPFPSATPQNRMNDLLPNEYAGALSGASGGSLTRPQPNSLAPRNPVNGEVLTATDTAPRSRPGRQGKVTPVSNDNSNRVVLQGDDEAVPIDRGKYVIKVDAGETGNAKPADHNPPPVITVASGVDNGTAPEARSAISMANDLRLKGDYTRAAKAYKQALPSAGDEKGYVYQQIAYCFQKNNDKESARTNYQNAITEYEKMVSAGKQVEAAQNGIRVCKNGIKLCE